MAAFAPVAKNTSDQIDFFGGAYTDNSDYVLKYSVPFILLRSVAYATHRIARGFRHGRVNLQKIMLRLRHAQLVEQVCIVHGAVKRQSVSFRMFSHAS
jgi:hypothetical protein